MNLGLAIKHLRTRPGKRWTQSEVAASLGLDVGTVTFWETNQRSPSADNKQRLCDLLEVSVSSLDDLAERYPDPECPVEARAHS